jgi:cobalt-zinc-cadmium efflux system outer membrane protein
VDAAVARLRSDVAAAHARLEGAVAEAQLLQQDILPGAVAAHDTSTKGFELGKFSFLEVLDSQRTLLQARAQHLKAVAEAFQAAAELDLLLSTGNATHTPPTNPAPSAAPGSTSQL